MKSDRYLLVFCAGLLALIGALMLGLYAEHTKSSTQAARITKLEADARTAWGKVYDMQEKRSDEMEAVRSEESLARFELQTKLDQCTSKGK